MNVYSIIFCYDLLFFIKPPSTLSRKLKIFRYSSNRYYTLRDRCASLWLGKKPACSSPVSGE